MNGLIKCVLLLLLSSFLPARADVVDANMNRSTHRIPTLTDPNITLTATVFKPNGVGPFPLLVMNHGIDQSQGFKPEDLFASAPVQHYWLARTFVERGYMVMSPMRRGVAGSGGQFDARACDIAANGVVHAADIAATLAYAAKLPEVNPTAMVVAGQSHGGLATLGLLASNYPQAQWVKAGVVFSGGLFHASPSCPWTPTRLVSAMTRYGKSSKLPTLWLYAPNDKTFEPPLVAEMLKAYLDAGAAAQFVSVLPRGNLDNGGHGFVRWRSNTPQWWPLVQDYLQLRGLPTKQMHTVAERYAANPSGFADLEDDSKVPTTFGGQARYRKFLSLPSPRAFVIGARGEVYSGAYETGAAEPTLAACEVQTQAKCRLYAVDNAVVYQP